MMADHDNDHNHEAFLDMCKNGETEKVRMALVTGVDGNVADNGDRTALMMAASNGHVAVVELLLQRPDVEARSLDQQFHNSQVPSASCHHQGCQPVVAGCISIHASYQGHSHLLSLSVFAHIKEGLMVVVIGMVSHHKSGYVFTVSRTFLQMRKTL